MDAYEATRVVMARIQALDPENAAKIMGLLLIQDHGEKEMIRLALGPESLLHSVVLKARKELGLSTTTPSSPAAATPPSPFLISRQNSSSRLLSPLSASSPTSWAPPPPFSRSNDELHGQDELISPGSQNPSPFYGSGDLIDDFQLQDQLSFLNDPSAAAQGNGDSMGLPYSGLGWGAASPNGYHRRSCSMAELCLGSDAAAGVGFGWKPCLYFARGYCKNGTNCRFLHGLPDDSPSKMDSVVEQQCHEFLLRSKSQRLMASAFPYLPSNAMPQSPSSSSGKCVNFLLQQQQSESQRAVATAAALMLGGDESHKFISRSRLERADFASLVNPGSRQIYLTFPADSTFREEDVSKYFSSYGPVQDVRIPYQQKRMFGFVTFVYPETVKLILAKGNPHFVCDARVLVKPYKEKGKVPDKKQQQQGERGDFSGCTTPTGLVDTRDPYELQQLGSGRLLYSGGGGGGQDAMLRRRLEEQQQVAELQQAIELQSRRFMGLQLLDLKSRTTTTTTQEEATPPRPPTPHPEDKSPNCAAASAAAPPAAFVSQAAAAAAAEQQSSVNFGDKEESPSEGSPNEDSGFQESCNTEHNLPDSPFASPTKASFASLPATTFSDETISGSGNTNHLMSPTTLIAPASTLDMASFKSCFFQMPRFSSGHGAVGM